MFAATWLGTLWFAAPIVSDPQVEGALPDRLRGVLVLGTAIPFALGLLHLLYAPACYAIAIACILVAWLRGRPTIANVQAPTKWYALPLCATLFVALPALQQPPMDGDTLGYHLPNALSWVHAHSVWTTPTRYWWYPAGSELFAAGIAATGGWWLVGLAGTCAALLVTFRLTAWGVSLGSPDWVAASLASAFICTGVAAVQTADLQNDLWLAALFLELLWTANRSSRSQFIAASVLSLIKPTGLLYAMLSGFWRKGPFALVALSCAPFGLWCCATPSCGVTR